MLIIVVGLILLCCLESLFFEILHLVVRNSVNLGDIIKCFDGPIFVAFLKKICWGLDKPEAENGSQDVDAKCDPNQDSHVLGYVANKECDVDGCDDISDHQTCSCCSLIFRDV